MKNLLNDHKSDIFSILTICSLWIIYRSEILQKTDAVFTSVFGKNLTGRSLPLQITVYALLFLLSLLIPILLRRLIEHDSKFNRLAEFLILLLIACPLIQLLIICANQILRRDDYWEIADAYEHGFPGSMFFEIRRYNGRYTGWGLKSLHAFLPDIPYIDTFLFLNQVLLIIGTTLLAYRFMKSRSGELHAYPGIKLQAFVCGFGLAMSFVLMSSNIWEFWFWGSGTMIYGFGISMCLLSLALVWNASEEASFRNKKMILPFFTCLITCGCSELCTASLAAFLVLLLIGVRIRTKKWNRQILFFLAEIFLCCLMIFSGTASLDLAGTHAHWDAQESVNEVQRLPVRLLERLRWGFESLQGYTFAKPRTLILFLLTAFITGTQMNIDKKSAVRLTVLAILLTFIAHAVLMINTMLDYMPPRVITIGICWYLTAMILFCMMIGSLLCPGKRTHTDLVKLVLCALVFAVSVNSFYSENIHEVRKIRSSWNIRENLLQMTAKEDEPMVTCSLPCLGSSRDDILPDPLDDFNIGTAQYYRVPQISAELRCPPWGEIFIPSDPWK